MVAAAAGGGPIMRSQGERLETRWGCQPINCSDQSHRERKNKKERDLIMSGSFNNLQSESLELLWIEMELHPFSSVSLFNLIRCYS